MPYSEIPDPLPDFGPGVYQVNAAVEGFPGSGMDSISLDVSLSGYPNTDQQTAAMDAWVQAIVDALAKLPHVTSINATKSLSIGFYQTITPTPPPE